MTIGTAGWVGPPPREVCIVMLSALGDAVHVLPVANALQHAWPECRITWVVQPAAYRLAAGHPAIDEFIVYHRRRGAGAWRGMWDVRRELRGRRFDLLLGLQVYFKAGLITGMADARVKLGFDRRRARDGQWLFTNARIPARTPQHVQDQYFEFLAFLGIDPEPVTWGLVLTDPEREAQRAYFAELGGPACAVVVGTSRREKNWEPDRWARVLDVMEAKHGLRPVLVGGSTAEERRIADAILRTTRARAVDALADDLRRLVWLLDGSALVVTPDTGPLHIARALGTPVVSLFGHTNPKRSGPYRAFADLVVDGYADYEGEDYSAGGALRDGMRRVTVDAVLAKVDLALSKYGAPGRHR